MTAYPSILVHADPSARFAARLALAQRIAAQHGSRIVVLYAASPVSLDLSFATAAGVGEAMTLLMQIADDDRDNARAAFDRARSSAAVPMDWRELRGEPLAPGIVEHAMFSDLLVFGQHDPADPVQTGVPADLVPSVAIASGKPVLVVPSVDVVSTFGREVLVAWKPTREAGRAVEAALPLLRGADRVHLCVAETPTTTPPQVELLEVWLRGHGVCAPVARHAVVADASAGDALLSLAADTGADLLVMGCYGHGRARELLLGGASRTVLASMTLPVLMTH